MAIDYAALKAIFGTTLPESHIFFATRAANALVPGYARLRKEYKMSPANTNRKVWKHFVSEYNKANAGPALAFTTNLPATKTAAEGDNVTWTVAVTGGTTPYTYQWYWKDILIDSATNPTAITAALTNSAVTPASNGAYKCVVKDNAGATITSVASTLTVTPTGP